MHDAAAGPLRLLHAPIGASDAPARAVEDWLMSGPNQPLMITIDCTSASGVEVIDLTIDGDFDPDCYIVEVQLTTN